MRLGVTLLLSLLAPIAAGAQKSVALTPDPIGVPINASAGLGGHAGTWKRTAGNDSLASAFDRNLTRGAAAGGVIGGIIGAFASEHQAVAAGFTHTPAVLFVLTYGGLGALLGIIAGTLLPGS